MKKKKDIIDFFGLNKPVYYIFNGIDFNNTVEVFSPCANIIFKNCNFNLHIYINIGNEVTFENNKYKDAVSDSIKKNFSLLAVLISLLLEMIILQIVVNLKILQIHVLK